MKVSIVIAVVAFLAVQLTSSAPTAEDKSDAGAVPTPAAADDTSHSVPESKAATAEAVVSPAEATPAEEKKP